MRRRLALAACVLPLALRPAAGQATDSLSTASVDVSPVLDSGVATPRYPEILRAARVDGTVHLRLTIDSAGRVDSPSIRVVSSTHDLFTSAVRRAVGEWRFRPARSGGRPVPVRHDVVVDFALPDADSNPLRPVHRVARGDDTTRVTLGWAPEPRLPAVSLQAGELRAAQLAAVRMVMPRAAPDSGRVTCISLRLGGEAVDPSPSELADLASGGRAVVGVSRCPPTYSSWMVPVDSAGRPLDERPRGALDPWHARVTRAQPWTGDIVVIRISTGQGGSGDLYRCEARRSDGMWRARCEWYGSWVS